MNRFRQHPFSIVISILIVCCVLSLALFLQFGDIKTFQTWKWIDILGEGGAAVFALLWLFLVLKSRIHGRVTTLFVYGLCFTFFHLWMDTLDEFIKIPAQIQWDTWLESVPFPIGLTLLTLGVYFWHQEQLAINKQMQKRELIFRDHRLFDALTPLADANYFKSQLNQIIEKNQSNTHSVILLDMVNFNQINQEYGYDEGSHILQHISQLISLNLRQSDLICRYAGDRFTILMQKTDHQQALNMTIALEKLITHSQYFHRSSNQQIPLQARTTYCEVIDLSAQTVLKRLNQQLIHLKSTEFSAKQHRPVVQTNPFAKTSEVVQ
uniref:diguanylate cyclase domain-containing protein n=1 Tax=uncultured Acinetobacter sp. TaxID=165433 RepID=UPI002634E9C0|nr:diguanylate cyclase [uncultured Acinetobacter sp.]